MLLPSGQACPVEETNQMSRKTNKQTKQSEKLNNMKFADCVDYIFNVATEIDINHNGYSGPLGRADRTLFKVRSVDSECPLSKIIPRKKETKYNLRNRTVHRPEINLDIFKNVFLNKLVFKNNI